MGGSKTDPGLFINWSLRLGTTASTCITFDKFWPISRDLVFDIRNLELWVVNEAIMNRRNIAKRDFYSTVVMWNRLGKHKANVEEHRLVEHRDCCFHNAANNCRQSTNCSPAEVHETEQRHFETSHTSLTGVNTLDDDFLIAIKNRLVGAPPMPGQLSLKPEPIGERFNMHDPKSNRPQPYVVTSEPSKPKKVPPPVATQVDDSMITEIKHQGTSTSHTKVASPFTQSVLNGASQQREDTAKWHYLLSRMKRDDEGYQRSSHLEQNAQTPQLHHDSRRMNRVDEGFQRAPHLQQNMHPNYTQHSFPAGQCQQPPNCPRPNVLSQVPYPNPGFQPQVASNMNQQSRLYLPEVPRVRSDVTVSIHHGLSMADGLADPEYNDAAFYPQETIDQQYQDTSQDPPLAMSTAQSCTCGARELNAGCYCKKTVWRDYDSENNLLRKRLEFKEKKRKYKEAKAEDRRRKKEEKRRKKEEARRRKRERQRERRERKEEQRARERERKIKTQYEKGKNKKGQKTKAAMCSCCKCHRRNYASEKNVTCRMPVMQNPPTGVVQGYCNYPEAPCPAMRRTLGTKHVSSTAPVRMASSPSCGDQFCPYVLMSTTHRSCTCYQPQTIHDCCCSRDVTALPAQVDPQPHLKSDSPDRSVSPIPARSTSAHRPTESSPRLSSSRAARDAARRRDIEAAPAIILPNKAGRGDASPPHVYHSALPDRSISLSPARSKSAHGPTQSGAGSSSSRANTVGARDATRNRDIVAAPAIILPDKVGRGDASEAIQPTGRWPSDPRFSSAPAGNVLIDLSERGRESSNKRYVPPCVLYLDCTKVKDLCVIIKDKYEDPS